MSDVLGGDVGAAKRAHFGEFVLDLNSWALSRAGEPVRLQPAALKLLAHFLRNPGRLFTRDELHSIVWPDVFVSDEALTQMIRRVRKAIESKGEKPKWLLTVPRRGYRFDGDVRWEGQPLLQPLAPLAPAPEEALPPEVNAFYGRRDELAQLQRLIQDGARLITILGAGGMGKTRLAIHFARSREQGSRPLFADLSEVTDIDGLALVMAGALNIPVAERGAEQNLDRIGRALSGGGFGLVILDNFEALTQAAPQTVGRWLGLAPNTHFLVTSRVRLALAGEQLIPLGPLAPDAARTLFLQRAAAGGTPIAEGAAGDGVVRLVSRLDHSPLAIELAAGRASVMSVDQLFNRLDRRFELLRSRRSDVPEKHRSLEAVIADSVDRLSADQRRVLSACALLPGPFSLETCEALVSSSEKPPPFVADLLQDLADRSLLWTLPASAGSRVFSMQESVRVYLRRETHSAEPPGLPLEEVVLSRLECLLTEARASVEVSTLLEAARRLDGAPVWRARLALVAAPWLRERGPWSTGLALLDRALEARSHLSTEVLVCLLIERGLLSPQESPDRRQALEAARAAAEAGGLEELSIDALLWLLDDWVREGRFAEVLEALPPPQTLVGASLHSQVHAESIYIFSSQCLGRLGRQDPRDGANPYGRWREASAEVLGGPPADAFAHLRPTASLLSEFKAALAASQAHVLNEQGRYAEAKRCHDEALVIYRRLGWRRKQGVVLTNLSSAQSFSGDPAAAINSLNEALAIFEAIGEESGLLAALTNRSLAYLLERRLGDAGRDIGRAQAIADAKGWAVFQVVLRQNLMSLQWLQGERSAALATCAEAMILAEGQGMTVRVWQIRLWRAGLLAGEGQLQAAQGDLDSAMANLDAGVGGRHFESARVISLHVALAKAKIEGDEARAEAVRVEARALAEKVGPQAGLLLSILDLSDPSQ